MGPWLFSVDVALAVPIHGSRTPTVLPVNVTGVVTVDPATRTLNRREYARRVAAGL